MAIVTMTQALKKLYKAVVGVDTKKNNPTKIVSDLADNYSGGESPLPDVTGSDNGMVLTVVEGEWDKANAASGGGNVVYVDFVPDYTQWEPSADSGPCTTDADIDEIAAAYQNGATIIGRYYANDRYRLLNLIQYEYWGEGEGGGHVFYFSQAGYSSHLPTYIYMSVDRITWQQSEDTTYYRFFQLNIAPYTG